MSDQNELKYVVLHNNPDGLEMNRLQRDLLFATGNVIRVQECPLHSLQPEFFKVVTRRPLTIILWGMKDRHGVGEKEGAEIFEVNSWGDAHNYCQGLRPHAESWADEKGKAMPYIHWKKDV